ncbi:MAG TPA: EutN/CcmL family microcompartment protein [Nitrospinota bacterium]|jgi:microcompartment protein CcmK/EutM|nr:EutN/CcmL family microcompartment protein [Nitrospinota bacterium]
MKLCRVVGNIQSTIKHQAYKGQKIMVVQPLDETLKEDGQTFLSVERALK